VLIQLAPSQSIETDIGINKWPLKESTQPSSNQLLHVVISPTPPSAIRLVATLYRPCFNHSVSINIDITTPYLPPSGSSKSSFENIKTVIPPVLSVQLEGRDANMALCSNTYATRILESCLSIPLFLHFIIVKDH